VEIEGIKIKNEKTYQVIKQILKRKESRPTQKTVLLLRLFAVGDIDAKELEILNHFDVLDEHKRNKNIKSYQEPWERSSKVFTGIKELYNEHDEQQKFFDNVIQLVDSIQETDVYW
jgi:hypothetical protein